MVGSLVSDEPQTYREYAIHVDNVPGGWVSGVDRAPYQAAVGDGRPSRFDTAVSAHESAQRLIKDYKRLGHDMTDHVHIVARTVTTTHDDWKAIDDGELEQARLWNTVHAMNQSPSIGASLFAPQS
jgi:hypothetical protein